MRDIDILGRTARLHERGLSLEADGRHWQIIMKHFGLDEDSKALNKNGYNEEVPSEGEPEEARLNPQEQKIYRGLAARVN